MGRKGKKVSKGPMDVDEDEDENLARSVRVLKERCPKELETLKRALLARQPADEVEDVLDSLHDAYRTEMSLQFFRMLWDDPGAFVRALFH